MKKHILKKFLHQTELPQEVLDLIKGSKLNIPLEDQSNIKTIPKGMVPFLTTEDNKFFKAFMFRYNNQIKLIPEPDPILVYFRTRIFIATLPWDGRTNGGAVWVVLELFGYFLPLLQNVSY